MRKIASFNFLTLNGFYKAMHEDISWHLHGEEGNEYSEKQLKADNVLLFGRKTYDMMSSFWPGKLAYEHFPVVAEGMNNSEKIVVSNTLVKADWNNTSIISGNLETEVMAIKATPGKNIVILGSGTIVTQLSEFELIDEYEFLIDPIAIGRGTTLFENLKSNLNLRFIESKVFKKTGCILLKYTRR